MTARERVQFLLDDGTFEETDKLRTHRCYDFGMESRSFTATDLLPVMDASKDGWFLFSHRTLQCLADRFRRRMR